MSNTEETHALLNAQPKNAKSAIIQKLAKDFPLSTKQLANIMHREYGLDITYQAVHNALQELEKDHVVTKRI